jgi:type II secretory pathway component PulF
MDSWFPTYRRLLDYRVEFKFPSWWPFYTTAQQSRSLLRLIAVALEENLPLAPLLEQWAVDERGVQKQRLQRLVRLLNRGRSLPDALEEVRGLLNDRDILAIRFDAQSGTRTAAVRKILDEPPRGIANEVYRPRRALLYFFTVVPLGLIVIAFTQIKVIPKLIRIFSTYDIDRPPALSWSLQLVDFVLSYWWLGPLAIFALLWILFSTHGGRAFRHSTLGRFFFSSNESLAAGVLQMVRVALSAGRPFPSAISTLARYHYDPSVRHKLLFVRNEVEQGADSWNSMAAAGLITSAEVRLLKTADRLNNRPWILDQLVAGKERRARQRLARAGEFLLPFLVLLIAGLVVFQALTVFHPLMRLMEGLL